MVLGVYRDASGKWAFLEFRTVAEATPPSAKGGFGLGFGFGFGLGLGL